MFKILKETTVWNCDYSVPNHTYLINPKNKVIAYLSDLDNTIHQLKSSFELNKKYRKFIEVNNAELQKLIPKDYKEENEKPRKVIPSKNVRVFNVKSGDKTYTVEYNISGHFLSCSCIGFGYRRKCRHVDAVALKLQPA
jgi:hypothetical protein